ncbi:MAG: hypothetical protein WC730_01510 [Patescibacteria group bacterium]|jgi:hypothetical protein
MKSLSETILETAAYFSFFGYPLTRFEIWKWLRNPVRRFSYFEVIQEIDRMVEDRELSACGAFLALESVETQKQERHRRYRHAIKKQHRVHWIVWYLSKIPWARGVALCNNLPFHFTREESDIDFFVITHRHRVWTTRLMAVLPLYLFRLRPHEAKHDPIDVSFFVDEDAFDFSLLRLAPDDPYLSVWIRSLVPLYEREPGVFGSFFAMNAWAGWEFPHGRRARRSDDRTRERTWFLPSLLPERLAKYVQLKRLPTTTALMVNQSSDVVVNDHMLKFHLNDRRQEIQAHQQALCKKNRF